MLILDIFVQIVCLEDMFNILNLSIQLNDFNIDFKMFKGIRHGILKIHQKDFTLGFGGSHPMPMEDTITFMTHT